MAKLHLISIEGPPGRTPSQRLRLYLHGELGNERDALRTLDLPPPPSGGMLALQGVDGIEVDLRAGVVLVLAGVHDDGSRGPIHAAATLTERQLLSRRIADHGVYADVTLETLDGDYTLRYRVVDERHAPRRRRWSSILARSSVLAVAW